MKNKLILIAIIVVAGAFSWLYISSKSKIKELELQLITLEEEKDLFHKKERDSLIDVITINATISKEKFDSIINIPPKIKYIRYEKPIYIDRTLDDAIRIIAEYEYDKKTKDTIR